MRVIGGSMRGRRLKAPEGMDVRPTTDNVKESMFNVIQFDIPGRRVLDLFAGTGQLGIECLSRGAESCVFVDKSPASLKILRENLRTLGLEARVQAMDAMDFLRRGESFDLILIDPPYDAKLYQPVLELVRSVDILSDGGIIVCESRKEEPLPELDPPYKKGREYRYGQVKLTLYTKERT